jgi:hypothetical protein
MGTCIGGTILKGGIILVFHRLDPVIWIRLPAVPDFLFREIMVQLMYKNTKENAAPNQGRRFLIRT